MCDKVPDNSRPLLPTIKKTEEVYVKQEKKKELKLLGIKVDDLIFWGIRFTAFVLIFAISGLLTTYKQCCTDCITDAEFVCDICSKHQQRMMDDLQAQLYIPGNHTATTVIQIPFTSTTLYS